MDPFDPDSLGTGLLDFFDWNTTSSNDFRIFGEVHTDFDGMADAWEFILGLDPRAYDSHLDSDADGWPNLSEFRANVGTTPFVIRTNSRPLDITTYPVPTVTFRFHYDGIRDSGDIVVSAYTDPNMDGAPDAQTTFSGLSGAYPREASTNDWDTGYLREGENWFFAWYDNDGDGSWSDGEPAGLAVGQPVNISWGTVMSIDVMLKESQPNFAQPDYELPGYGRFEWSEIGAANSYIVRIRNISETGAPLVLERTIDAPRTYFHEGDFMTAEMFGLPQAGYEWFIYHTQGEVDLLHESGIFVVVYPDSPTAPILGTPAGTILTHAIVELEWGNVTGATRYRVQLATDIGMTSRLVNELIVAPCPDGNGDVTWRLPIMVGDGTFTNGTYYWRVRAQMPGNVGPWSTVQSLGIDTAPHPAGPFSLGGDILYFGKVTNGQFVVQAYNSSGFSLLPDGQVTVSNITNAADWPENMIPFALHGLYAGTYYVRGFLDQDADKQQDVWETSGFVRQNAYIPHPQSVPSTRLDLRLPLTLADTDNDRIADDWEYQHFGDLTTAGAGTLRGYTDSNSDGVNDFESYAFTPLNLSPIDPDATGSDGIPLRIKTALGLDPFAPLYFDITGVGWTGSGQPVLQWYSASGGTVQGDTAGRATMSGGGAELIFQVQYSLDLQTWQDVQPGTGTVVYNASTGEFEYIDSSSFDSSRFYRYRVMWSD
jgi:hypothetical protein